MTLLKFSVILYGLLLHGNVQNIATWNNENTLLHGITNKLHGITNKLKH